MMKPQIGYFESVVEDGVGKFIVTWAGNRHLDAGNRGDA